VSIATDGIQGNGPSRVPSISSAASLVAFESTASNLVNNDSNSAMDIFVHNRQDSQTVRISLSSQGTQANDSSSDPTISADGRYVAFESDASNLVGGDNNNSTDIFVRDLHTGQTERVSMSSSGVEGNLSSFNPAISSNGQFVAFLSYSTNLVSGDTNDCSFPRYHNCVDVFVRDRQTRETSRVSVASSGTQANNDSFEAVISGDGRYVAFSSWATNLVSGISGTTIRAYQHDRLTSQTSLISVAADGTPASVGGGLSISADGRYTAFSSSESNLVVGDTNDEIDVFVHDKQTETIVRASVASDRSEANGSSQGPVISADGRFLSFYSDANNLVDNDNNEACDVFVHDLATGQTSRVSTVSDGSCEYLVFNLSISNEGRYVVFDSSVDNLVNGDTNGTYDIFLYAGQDFTGAGIVFEARADIGMPYSVHRGCPSPYTGCGGPYHGFYYGVCTDLAMDAYNAGMPFNIQDHLAHPGRYRHASARNAEDMRRYFHYNQQWLPHTQTYQPGDIAFFDWNADGLCDHVGVVSEVDAGGHPTRMVHAPGVCSVNPSGRAFEQDWNSHYNQHIQGHTRLSETGALTASADETLQLLRVAIDSPSVALSLRDANGKSTSDTHDENLVATGVEASIPYIPGGWYADQGAEQIITVTWPLSNTNQYFVQLTGQSTATYHLRVETLQGASVTHAEVFTQAIAPGETHGSAITLSTAGGTIEFSATSPTPAPLSDVPESLTLAGLVGTSAQGSCTINETGGQQALQSVDLSATELMDSLGGLVSGSLLSISPDDFTVPAGGSQQLDVQVNLAGVAPGVYRGALVIRSDNAGTRMIPLTLEVQFHQVHLPTIFKSY